MTPTSTIRRSVLALVTALAVAGTPLVAQAAAGAPSAKAFRGKVAPAAIVSPGRSAKSNASLRAASKGKQVADNSLHVKGKAMDVRIQGVDLTYLRKAALSMERGGVGYYPVSNFVHVDTGRVRTWQGS